MCQIGFSDLLCLLWGSRTEAVLWLVLAMHHSVGKGRQGLFSCWTHLLMKFCSWLQQACVTSLLHRHLPDLWSHGQYLARQDKAEGHLAAEACTQLDADWQVTSDVSSLHCRSFQESVRLLQEYTTRALFRMCLWMPAYPSSWVRSDPCLTRKEKLMSQTFGLVAWSAV